MKYPTLFVATKFVKRSVVSEQSWRMQRSKNMHSFNSHSYLPPIPPFHKTVTNHNCQCFPSIFNPTNPPSSPSVINSNFKLHCTVRSGEEAYSVLGVEPGCSAAELKAAFRSKVKQFHPDVNNDTDGSDTRIRRVIQAYEVLTNLSRSEIIESECLNPFDNPECEAFDVFVNEVLCIGKGCPYSCVQRAPHAFAYTSETGTARVTSQEHGEDYQVQLALGQCPRSCIHYVTPSQRIILEELLESVLNKAYDCSAEAEFLYSLIVKAKFENNRFRKPKKQPKTSTQHVDWF